MTVRGKTEVLRGKPVPLPLIRTLRLTRNVMKDSARKNGRSRLQKLPFDAVQVSNCFLI